MTIHLHIDFETCSQLELPDVGVHRYAEHASTDVLLCCFAVDDGPVSVWMPGDPVPEEIIEAAKNPDWFLVAHNAMFERTIMRQIMTRRYGWPEFPIAKFRCTMARALSLALPARLDKVAAALGLEERKDAAGARLMRRMAKGEPGDIVALASYCKQDVI